MTDFYIPSFDPKCFFIRLPHKFARFKQRFKDRGYEVRLTKKPFEEKVGVVHFWVEAK